MIRFNAKYLPMLLPFVADCDIRYYLEGISVEPAEGGGVYLVATDGHKLIAVHDAGGLCSEPTIIRVSRDVKRHCKPRLKPSVLVRRGLESAGFPFVEVNPITERLIVADFEERFVQPGKCIIGGCAKFPDWRRVMPDFDKLVPGTPDWFRSKYIVQAVQAAPEGPRNTINDAASVRFWHQQGVERGVVAVQYLFAPEACAFIMPIRQDDQPFSEAIQQTMRKPKPAAAEVAA